VLLGLGLHGASDRRAPQPVDDAPRGPTFPRRLLGVAIALPLLWLLLCLLLLAGCARRRRRRQMLEDCAEADAVAAPASRWQALLSEAQSSWLAHPPQKPSVMEDAGTTIPSWFSPY
jgi:hypothetical protein